MTYQIGVFATGRGQGSRGLLAAIHEGIASGHIRANVAFVFSNRERGEFEATDGFFDQVAEYGYPLVTSSFRKFRGRSRNADWRALYDAEVMAKIAPYTPDLCVLTGYLLILGPALTRRYTMVNLHPAAPAGPAGMWQDVIWRLIDQQARASGNTIFYATEDLDRGPPVTFSTYPIRGEAFDACWKAVEGKTSAELRAEEGESLPLFQIIRQHGMARERPLVVETLKSFAEGRVRVADGLIVSKDGKALTGLDLTQQIEAIVARVFKGESQDREG